MASKELVKLETDLNKAEDLWTDLVTAAKALVWPKKADLTDIVDSDAAWRELHDQIEELREASKEVQHLAKEIDEVIEKLSVRMRDSDPEIMNDSAMVVFLSAAVPERRYELVYECQKLWTLTERLRAEGKSSPSETWTAQREKILHNAQRGLKDCEWQLDEITKTRQAEPLGAPAPEVTGGSEHHGHHAAEAVTEAASERREPHEKGEGAEKGEGPEKGEAAEKGEVAEREEPAALLEVVESAASAVSAAIAESSDGDARVEEDVLDGS